ncbi:unannotated protein [freshwater metagenome]|uniref:Unannotated protein n=1 Tax=freshwater metagenome TaxID=449393 RepID=A0A6J6S7B7_9ZZZZ
MVPVLVEQLELERVGQIRRRAPGLGVRLEATHHESADLLLEVGPAVRVAHDRQVGVGALDRLGDDVEVLGRVQRHRHADLVGERLGPLPGTVDDHLGLDVAEVGADPGDPSPCRGRRLREAGDPHLLDDPGPTLAGAAGERLRDIAGVDLPVARQPDRAEQVLDLHHRPQLLGALGGDQLALQVVRRGVGRRAAQLHHPVFGAGDDHPADVAVAGRKTGLGLQLGVQLGGVLHQPGPALRGPQWSDQPGRVPGRAAGQASLLQDEHVAPAEPGEVVGDRGTDDTAADDHRPGPGRQLSHGRSPPGRVAGAVRRRRRPPSRSAPPPSRRSRSRGGWRPPG